MKGARNIEARLEKLITAIHAAAPMVNIEFAGAGAQALAWLHAVGGSSRTILEATDRYAASSIIDAVGFVPDQFSSPRVARALAMHAFMRACSLTSAQTPVAGIGCTAAIATERLKRGAHRCFLAVCDARGIMSYALTLSKGRRTRQQEEQVVSLLILKAVAEVCGVEGVPAPELFKSEELEMDFEVIDWPDRLLAGEIGWLAIFPDGRLTPGKTWPRIALLSGSFNPLHRGHQVMAQVAADILQQDVFFELPLINADKAAIDKADVKRRTAQFTDVATVILSCAPLFSQKAQLFPHSVFIAGIDTVERLLQPRFYDGSPPKMIASLELIRQAGCRFLVAGRVLRYNRFLTLDNLDLPAGYEDLFEQIPEDCFRVDISSTAIRAAHQES